MTDKTVLPNGYPQPVDCIDGLLVPEEHAYAEGWNAALAAVAKATVHPEYTLPLDEATAAKVANWISKNVEIGDVDDDGTVWVKLSDVTKVLDTIGDDSLWFSGAEWNPILEAANKWSALKCQYVYCAPGHERCNGFPSQHDPDECDGHVPSHEFHTEPNPPCAHAMKQALRPVPDSEIERQANDYTEAYASFNHLTVTERINHAFQAGLRLGLDYPHGD